MNSPIKYLGLLGQIGFIIAIPIVILALTGRYLDGRFHTSPWFLITGIILAFLISSAILYSQVIKSMKLLEEQDKKASGSQSEEEKDNTFAWDDLDDEEDE